MTQGFAWVLAEELLIEPGKELQLDKSRFIGYIIDPDYYKQLSSVTDTFNSKKLKIVLDPTDKMNGSIGHRDTATSNIYIGVRM